jgi:hypothetical protein
MMTKPYLLIAGYQYYPSYGTGDWIGCFSTKEDAEEEVIEVVVPKYRNKKFGDGIVTKWSIRDMEYDWYEIVDLREWMGDD